jgi:hypothetical protein
MVLQVSRSISLCSSDKQKPFLSILLSKHQLWPSRLLFEKKMKQQTEIQESQLHAPREKTKNSSLKG